ncbi:MAG: Tol-Pal system protein TolB [Sulfurimonas sp.]|nr:Tol-Pal system protein TolB [Sulfurimonas sp.]
MKIFFSMLLLFSLSFASDATIEVIKKVDSLPSIAVEDASVSYDESFKMKFFKTLIADLNVLSILNVDRYYRKNNFDASNVLVENKDFNYVLRYKMFQGDGGSLNVQMIVLQDNKQVFGKSYKVSNTDIHVFVSHAMAYDLNEFMGESSVEWMKKKVIFIRMTAPKRSEIIIADYTLAYTHVIVKGGFNIFPKWADKGQTGFYYTSLDSQKPTLMYVDIKTASKKKVISSDGMLVCSDVSADSKTLLLTMAPDGQPDIYSYNVDSKKSKKITNYKGIDVNGQFMDNNKIAFVSERMGYPNIFSANVNGSNVEQLVYYGNSNSSCSANGEYLVYKARESSSAFSGNTFNLHLISTKTDSIRRLTASGVNEFPRFSKDGDAVIYIKNYQAQSSIGIIRLNHNRNFLFPLNSGRIQSMDW